MKTQYPSLPIIIGFTIIEVILYGLFGVATLEGALSETDLNSYAIFSLMFTLITYLAYFLGIKDGNKGAN